MIHPKENKKARILKSYIYFYVKTRRHMKPKNQLTLKIQLLGFALTLEKNFSFTIVKVTERISSNVLTLFTTTTIGILSCIACRIALSVLTCKFTEGYTITIACLPSCCIV